VRVLLCDPIFLVKAISISIEIGVGSFLNKIIKEVEMEKEAAFKCNRIYFYFSKQKRI
jgi:hypothetical protein